MELTYRITQILTGHGCFGEYLKRIGAEATAICHHCGADTDTAQHTLEECEVFETQRSNLRAAIGPNISPAGLIISPPRSLPEKRRGQRLPPLLRR